MATVTPLKDIPDFDKNQLQQILLERDESQERMVQIVALKQEKAELLEQLKNDTAAFHATIAALSDDKAALKAVIAAVYASLESVVETPKMKEIKLAEATEAKERAEKEATKQQAIIEEMSLVA
jgi:septal ring factor EnvC (AmiA/AmiB activator)